jgi:hypothetical protein
MQGCTSQTKAAHPDTKNGPNLGVGIHASNLFCFRDSGEAPPPEGLSEGLSDRCLSVFEGPGEYG